MTKQLAKFKHNKSPFAWKQSFLNEPETPANKERNKKLFDLKPRHWSSMPEWFCDLCIQTYEAGYEPFFIDSIFSHKFGKRKAKFFDKQTPNVWEEAIYRSTSDLPNFLCYENNWDTAPQKLVKLAIKYKKSNFEPVEKKLRSKTVFIDDVYEVVWPEKHIWILEKNTTEDNLAA